MTTLMSYDDFRTMSNETDAEFMDRMFAARKACADVEAVWMPLHPPPQKEGE